jgi:hypothetical protein
MDVAEATPRQDQDWEVPDAVVHRTGWLVDQVLIAPRTTGLVARYFEPEHGLAADSFDLLGATSPTALEPADLLAATFLDVPISALAARHLLATRTAQALSRLLRSVPVDADLWSARPQALDAAAEAHALLQEADGIGPVRAAKLLARKRPRLVPVLDNAAVALLELPDALGWSCLRLVLADAGRRDRVEALRPDGLDPGIPLLRLLDVAIWVTASGGRRERAGARAGDL